VGSRDINASVACANIRAFVAAAFIPSQRCCRHTRQCHLRQDIFRTRQSSLERHLPWLDAEWASGCRNGADLWRRLKEQGFRGSLRVVTEWATRRRRAEKADAENLQRIPSARTIARLMTIGRNNLSKADTVTITAIEIGVPCLVEAREAIAAFQAMVRNKADVGLAAWIEKARKEPGSLICQRSRQ
jgi:transposase